MLKFDFDTPSCVIQDLSPDLVNGYADLYGQSILEEYARVLPNSELQALQAPSLLMVSTEHQVLVNYYCAKYFGITTRSSLSAFQLQRLVTIHSEIRAGLRYTHDFSLSQLLCFDVEYLETLPTLTAKANLDQITITLYHLKDRPEIPSPEEAIVIGATDYGIYLGESRYPQAEYFALKNSPNYIPVDPIFRQRFKRAAEFYSLYSNYIPIIGDLYTAQQIRTLAEYWDIPEMGLDSIVTQRLYIESEAIGRLHWGGHPECNLKYSSILLSKLSEVPWRLKVTIQLQTYTMEELVEIYLRLERLVIPHRTDEFLTLGEVHQLQHWAKLTIAHDFPKGEVSSQHAAVQLLEITQRFHNAFNAANYLRLQQSTLQFSEAQTQELSELLAITLKLGWYMRGWQESQEYPLLESLTFFTDTTTQEELETRVQQGAGEFMQLFGVCSKTVRDFYVSLPLVSRVVINACYEYILTPKSHGKLYRRLQIATGLKASTSIKTCLRLTSNLLIVTATTLQRRLLNIKANFNLDQLEFIA